MIISASRRTDIPGYYFLWFLKRLEEGYLYVRNPYFKKQIHMVDLSPGKIDCIVFWTKYPAQMVENLHTFLEYNIPFYILFTITPYNRTIEKNIPEKTQIIKMFKYLSEKIGKEKLIWRYDPLILFSTFNVQKHSESFENIASELEGYTERCILGFLTLYKKLEKNLTPLNISLPSVTQKAEIALNLSRIASKYGIKLQTCAEDLSGTPASHLTGKCIDDKLLKRITHKKISSEKDRGQRSSCKCIKSIDIGAYNTCPGGCIYCYANINTEMAKKNFKAHNPGTPILDGNFYTLTNLTNKNIMM